MFVQHPEFDRSSDSYFWVPVSCGVEVSKNGSVAAIPCRCHVSSLGTVGIPVMPHTCIVGRTRQVSHMTEWRAKLMCAPLPTKCTWPWRQWCTLASDVICGYVCSLVTITTGWVLREWWVWYGSGQFSSRERGAFNLSYLLSPLRSLLKRSGVWSHSGRTV